MTNALKKVFLLAILFFIVQCIIFAQPPDPGSSPEGTGTVVGGTSIPLDGGTFELLIIGLSVLGLRKLKMRFKNHSKK